MSRVLQLFFVVCALCAFSHSPARADVPRKIAKVGQLYGTDPATAKPYDTAFREGLRDLGYVEGQNIVFLPRYAQGDPTRFPALVNELMAEGVDLLVVAITAIPAVKQATRTIPIVAPTMGRSPVEDGLVVSLARPGGNLTGGCDFGVDQESKFMEFAKEVVPHLKHAGLLYEATNSEFQKWSVQFRASAQASGVTLHPYGVRDVNEIRNAFDYFAKERIQALILWATPLMLLHRASIQDLASRKFPVITQSRDFAEAGALISYSADFVQMWRHGAVYVDKILKGTNPGDIPIERPNKIDVRINLKTAKALGITIPESILLRADEVIR